MQRFLLDQHVGRMLYVGTLVMERKKENTEGDCAILSVLCHAKISHDVTLRSAAEQCTARASGVCMRGFLWQPPRPQLMSISFAVDEIYYMKKV